MKKLDFVASIIILLLGSFHTLMTPILAEKFNCDPVQFIAIGIMFVLLGLINLARLRTEVHYVFVICTIGNILGLFWLCSSFVHSFLHGESFSQGILPLICMCIVLFCSLYFRSTDRKGDPVTG